MSSIVTDRGVIHYETFGRGQPVILLHCWLGSWNYWLSTMEALSEGYKTYALDFWGFGESGKQGLQFRVPDYVEMVHQFMEQLGILRARVMGHSMGGTVSLAFALAYPNRVQKIAIVGSPITGDGLALMLKLAAKKPLAAIAYNLPGLLPLGVRLASPFLTRDWRRWSEMFEQDLSKTTLESFHYSIASLRKTDLRPRLREIRVPILGIYGLNDRIVNPNQGEILANGNPLAQVVYFEHSGHFPMLDEEARFHQTLREFLDR